jgi:uncharacterized protein (DUF1330 family)
MAVLLVARVLVKDPVKLRAGYIPASARLVEEMGGRYVIRGRAGHVLEGTGADGSALIVIEWPDRQAALNFWNSPQYAEVKKLREGVAEVDIEIYET